MIAEVKAVLIRGARRLYADEPTELGLDGELFAVDGSLIELSVALFPWARWQVTQAAVKPKAMLAVAKEMPALCSVVAADCHDVNLMDDNPVSPGSYHVFDRGYLDFRRLRRIAQAGAWFVIRAKRNTCFYVCQSRPVDKASGMRRD